MNYAAIDKRKYTLLALVAGVILVCDQATKAIVLKLMPLHQSVTVIPGFFSLTHVHNPGGAFGFMANQGAEVRQVLFLFASSVAIGLILYFYHKTPSTHRWLALALASIFGGAVGNLVDRLRFGKVVDFLDFYIGQLHWPAFNVADSAITIGIGIFMVHILFNKLPE